MFACGFVSVKQHEQGLKCNGGVLTSHCQRLEESCNADCVCVCQW